MPELDLAIGILGKALQAVMLDTYYSAQKILSFQLSLNLTVHYF